MQRQKNNLLCNEETENGLGNCMPWYNNATPGKEICWSLFWYQPAQKFSQEFQPHGPGFSHLYYVSCPLGFSHFRNSISESF